MLNDTVKNAKQKHSRFARLVSLSGAACDSSGAAAAATAASIHCPPVLDPFLEFQQLHHRHLQHLQRIPPRQISVSESLFSNGSSSSSEFSWLVDQQVNNSSGESSSRKLASKETSRREVDNWHFLYFRFRLENYHSLVYALKQSAKGESAFSEEHLDKWTTKMRFKIRRSAPLKTALLACVTRLGLQNDAEIVFCVDGFYGDSLTGRLRNGNEVPNRVVQGTSTCRAMGLGNGSSLFVSRASRFERENASIQTQLDMLKATTEAGSGLDDDLTEPSFVRSARETIKDFN